MANRAKRAAALEAVAQRDDPKEALRFTAAGCIAHLSDNPSPKDTQKPAKP